MPAPIPKTLTFQSLAKSGAIPYNEQRSIQSAFDRLMSSDTAAARESRLELHITAAAEGVRQTGEAGIFGAILGAAHAYLATGLDIQIPHTKQALPLDGVGALLGLVAGAAAAAEPHGIGKTIQNGGAACMSIYSFRKVHDLVATLKDVNTKEKIGKANFSGDGGWAEGSNHRTAEFGGDPILQLAKKIKPR